MASRKLMKRAPILDFVAEDMTALMIWGVVMTAPLFDRMDESSGMKIFHLLCSLVLFLRGKRHHFRRRAPYQKRGM